jgi:prolyl oligopeptidase
MVERHDSPTLDLRVDTPEVLAWQRHHTAETVAALHAIDGYATLGDSVLRFASAARRWLPIRKGDRWFQQKQLDAAAELPAITVRASIDGPARVLVDINDHATLDGPPVSLGWMTPSPDGSALAYSVTTAGTEVNEVFLLDVATGRRLPDVVPWNVYAPPSWLPDGSGFWCATQEVIDDAMTMRIRRFLLGEPVSEWVAPLPDDVSFPLPVVSKDGRYVAIATGNTELRVDYLIDADLRVTPLLDGVPGAFRGTISDGTFYALTNHGAPRGRVVAIPLESSTDLASWTELIGAGSDTLTDFEIVGDAMVVSCLRDCSAAIDIVDRSTGERTAVPLPGNGGVGTMIERFSHPGLPVFARGDGEFSFVYSDPATSPGVYRYLVDERRLECLEAPATTLPDVTVSYLTARSADGVEVPAHVVHRADLDLDRSHPTLLVGYGGFNLAELPAFLEGNAAWVEAGGVYVLAHPRGGSDFGADWWHAGRRDKKQNTFDDFYAVARHLVALGLTSAAQLAVYGVSNGGLLAAVALTQRPELFAAVVADVPVTDLLNISSNPLTYAICRDEYGDTQIPAEREWLQAIDPLVNAAPAEYPATLVIAGANDPRCPASQSRLLVERVRTEQLGTAPIWLRVHADQGHGTQGAIDAARRLTEILAFCATHTGLALT